MEKRKHTRLQVKVSAELRCSDGSSFQGVTRNLSFSGAYINLTEEHQPQSGDTCDLFLFIGENPEYITIKFKCDILRAEKEGVGLKYRYVEIDGYHHFEQLMINSSPEPHKLLEELRHSPGLELQSK